MNMLVIFLLLLPAATSFAAEDLIRLSPEQALRGGVLAAAVGELQSSGGIRLPAQVVVPPAQVEVVAAPLPAMVLTVRAAYGESVKKGQVLARLQGAQLLELQREFAHARSRASLAGESLRRDEGLFADGIISQGRLSATRAAEREAALHLAEKRQALQLAGAGVPGADAVTLSGSAEIRAPFDGVVLEAAAQPGSRVDAMTPLFKLGRIAPLWLEIQAAPAQATGIARGDAVRIAGCTRPGTVALVAPHMQTASQSLLIRAELPRPEGCIRPFQYVQVEIMSARSPAAGTWRLPPAALTRHQGQVWVFVEAPGGFRPLAVTLLGETPEAALVSADLPATSRIAVKGAAVLKATWLGLGAAEGK